VMPAALSAAANAAATFLSASAAVSIYGAE